MGGFKAAADFLSKILNKSPYSIFSDLKKIYLEKNEKVFDRYLISIDRYQKRLVDICIRLYRSHTPQLSLYPEADRCLDRFADYPLYVVTDGNKIVQKKKFLALGLSSRVKKCLCTYAYGHRRSKPSPYCFLKICEWEQISPSNVWVIGDNPHKDFVGLKSYHFNTVRVLTGPYRAQSFSRDYDADRTIKTLDGLTEKNLIKWAKHE